MIPEDVLALDERLGVIELEAESARLVRHIVSTEFSVESKYAGRWWEGSPARRDDGAAAIRGSRHRLRGFHAPLIPPASGLS